MKYKPDPKAEERRRSAAALVNVLLANQRNILPEHIRELLDILLWKITEADGKYKTRYQSNGALTCAKRLRRHDHVYPRKPMIDKLLSAPQDVDRILKDAIGCTVTLDEHNSLRKFDEKCYGWGRYRQADVPVVNTETDEPGIPVDSE
jgi:hypothetical protein